MHVGRHVGRRLGQGAGVGVEIPDHALTCQPVRPFVENDVAHRGDDLRIEIDLDPLGADHLVPIADADVALEHCVGVALELEGVGRPSGRPSTPVGRERQLEGDPVGPARWRRGHPGRYFLLYKPGFVDLLFALGGLRLLGRLLRLLQSR